MKNFQWNSTLVYNLPYNMPQAVQIIDHEYHISKIDQQVSQMDSFPEALDLLEKIFNNR